jgi:Flp pilus assembly protein TadG
MLNTHRQAEGPDRPKRRRTLRRGAAVVEAAATLPVILTLLIGILEVGRMVNVQITLNNAAREGSRQAAAGVMTSSQVQQVVLNYLTQAGVPTTSATVTVNDLTSPGTDPSAALENDQLQVSVTLPYSAVRWCAASLVTNSSTQLTASAIWYSARAQPYPSGITVPQGY